MTTVFDVPADRVIAITADRLRKNEHIVPPEWAPYVKTGIHREKQPQNEDWWHARVAAVLRKVYLNGPVGVEHIRAMFGGARDDGSSPYHARAGSGSIVRASFHQLEKAEFIEMKEGKGRIITAKGRSLLDNIAHEVHLEMVKENPQMSKY